MLGAPAAAWVLVESTRVSHRRLAEIVRHSQPDGFPAYTAHSPESGLVSLRRLAGTPPLKLDTSVGVPGPHGFAVRECRARLAQQSRPSHPAPTSVTIAIRPSEERDGARYTPDL